MNSLTKRRLKRLILQELNDIVGEDALVSGENDIYRTGSRRRDNFMPHARTPHNLSLSKFSDSHDDFGGGDSCNVCGGLAFEGECMESDCGGSMVLEGKMCEQCGSSNMYEGECMECGYSKGGMLEEGNCGCGTCATCGDNDMDDDFVPDHLERHMSFDGDDITDLVMNALGHHDHDHGENELIDGALGTLTGLGYHVDAHKDNGQLDGHKYKHNDYMAKPSLYKVAKYSQKLLQMIPDGYELDDWQRTKIAQISDDISEVYHSLDYDFHDDEF